MHTSLTHLRYTIEHNARYHARREAFFDQVHRSILFVIVVTGSAAFASIQSEGQIWGLNGDWLALVPAILAALDLTFSLGEKTIQHRVLYWRFRELLSTVISDENPEQNLSGFNKKFNDILKDEPPTYYALNAMCYNEIVNTYGLKESSKIPLKWYQWLFMHVHQFQSMASR